MKLWMPWRKGRRVFTGDAVLILLTGIVAFGWTFGAALILLSAFAGAIPNGWTVRDLLAGGGRRSALLVGLVLFLVSTALFLGMEWTMSAG